MATAMKGASDRLVTVERELQLCQVRNRRLARPPAETPAPSAAPAAPAEAARPTTPSELSPEEAFRVLAGPVTWIPTAFASRAPCPQARP
jgi:hypothetical protein